jgi:hypothetical protein
MDLQYCWATQETGLLIFIEGSPFVFVRATEGTLQRPCQMHAKTLSPLLGHHTRTRYKGLSRF